MCIAHSVCVFSIGSLILIWRASQRFQLLVFGGWINILTDSTNIIFSFLKTQTLNNEVNRKVTSAAARIHQGNASHVIATVRAPPSSGQWQPTASAVVATTNPARSGAGARRIQHKSSWRTIWSGATGGSDQKRGRTVLISLEEFPNRLVEMEFFQQFYNKHNFTTPTRSSATTTG